MGMSAAGSQSRATETADGETKALANCAAVIKPIPIAPIAAIAMRLCRVKVRNHEAIMKKENATRFINSAFLILEMAVRR